MADIINIENKTILVTGAIGFIGSNLVLKLLKNKYLLVLLELIT